MSRLDIQPVLFPKEFSLGQKERGSMHLLPPVRYYDIDDLLPKFSLLELPREYWNAPDLMQGNRWAKQLDRSFASASFLQRLCGSDPAESTPLRGIRILLWGRGEVEFLPDVVRLFCGSSERTVDG